MAKFESGTCAWRHKPNDAAADIESEQVALGIQQVYLRAEARMHQPDTGHDVRTKRFLRNRFRYGDDHIPGQGRDTAARNGTPQSRSEELRYLFEIPFNAQEVGAEEHRRHAESHFLFADGLFAKGDARLSPELHPDERDDQEIGLRVRRYRREEEQSGGVGGDSASSQSRQDPVRPSQ